jgi:hypothetical protein
MIYFSVLLPIMSSLFMIQRCRYVSCTEYLLHAFFFCVDDTFWIAFFFLVCLKSWKDIVPPCFVPFCTLPVSTSNELLVLEAKLLLELTVHESLSYWVKITFFQFIQAVFIIFLKFV